MLTDFDFATIGYLNIPDYIIVISEFSIYYLSATLCEDLLSSDVVMSERVSRVAILIEDDRVGDLGKESLGNRDVRLWRVPGSLCWGSDDLSSKGSQCGHLKLRLLWRQKTK